MIANLHCMSIIIWIIILFYIKKNNSVAPLNYAFYILTSVTSTYVTPLLLTPPAKKGGAFGVEIILHTVSVFVDPIRNVPFKVQTLPVPPMVRAGLIEYAHRVCGVCIYIYMYIYTHVCVRSCFGGV